MAKFSLSNLSKAAESKGRKSSDSSNRMKIETAKLSLDGSKPTMKLLLKGAELAEFSKAERDMLDQASGLICRGEAWKTVGAVKNAIKDGDEVIAKAELWKLMGLAEGRSELPKASEKPQKKSSKKTSTPTIDVSSLKAKIEEVVEDDLKDALERALEGILDALVLIDEA
jgi:hypothetical protein